MSNTHTVEQVGCIVLEGHEGGGKDSHVSQASYRSEQRWHVGDGIAHQVAGNFGDRHGREIRGLRMAIEQREEML